MIRAAAHFLASQSWPWNCHDACVCVICCRKGDPFQSPKLGSCLTLGNELSEETHVLTKGNLVRVSDPRSEDDISDSVYSSQVKGAF